MSLSAVLYKVALAVNPLPKPLLGGGKSPSTPLGSSGLSIPKLVQPQLSGASLDGLSSSAGLFPSGGSGWGKGVSTPAAAAAPAIADVPAPAPAPSMWDAAASAAPETSRVMNPVNSDGTPAPAAATTPPAAAAVPQDPTVSAAPPARINRLTGKPFGWMPGDDASGTPAPAAPAAAPSAPAPVAGKVNYTDADNAAYDNYHAPTDKSWSPELQADRGKAMDAATAAHQAQTAGYMRDIDSSAARSMKIYNPAAYAKLVNAARERYGIRGQGSYDTMWRGARGATAQPAAQPSRAPVSTRLVGAPRPATAADVRNLRRASPEELRLMGRR